MKLVVDTNIIISSLINPNGKELDLILNPSYNFEKYTCYLAFIEILEHKEKILKVSKLNENDFLELTYRIFRKIDLINEEQIPINVWLQADALTKDIDSDDNSFLALSLFLDAYLWTGDKKLINGLEKKNYTKFIRSYEIVEKFSL